jgi:ankyrin repeat protein
MTKKQIDKMLLKGCEAGDFNKVRLAINFGADLEAKNNSGRTPLHLASEFNRISIAKLLIEMGANLEAKDNQGRNPLHVATMNNSIETATLLLDAGADLEAKDRWGNTPLDYSPTEERKDLLK